MAGHVSPFHCQPVSRPPLSRREFLWHSGGGLGGIALASLLGAEGFLAAAPFLPPGTPPASRPHFTPRARRVVQLFMAGAASHIDLFDYKPELIKRHGQPSNFGEPVEAFQDGLGPWMRPVWDFKPYGRSGKMLSDVVSALGEVVDELAFIHNVVGKTGVHSQGTLLQTTGFNRPGFPGMGCWVSYGLGSMNQNLPTFVVLPDHRGLASNGTKNWDSAFLPALHQGTPIYPRTANPIANLFPAKQGGFITAASHAAGVSVANDLNQLHASRRAGDDRLEARIRSYELAARMQLVAPEALDISREPASILKMYGLDHGSISYSQEINATEETDLLQPQVPGRAPLTGARRALCADLVRKRQRLPAAQLGLARGCPARSRSAGHRHGPRHGSPYQRSQAARFAGGHRYRLDDGIWPHAIHPG
jgi:hypothetical protein